MLFILSLIKKHVFYKTKPDYQMVWPYQECSIAMHSFESEIGNKWKPKIRTR